MTQPTAAEARASLAALIGYEPDEHDAEFEKALDAYRVAVLREAAGVIDATYTGPGVDRFTRYGADLLRRMAEEARS